jgi:serine protease Do
MRYGSKFAVVLFGWKIETFETETIRGERLISDRSQENRLSGAKFIWHCLLFWAVLSLCVSGSAQDVDGLAAVAAIENTLIHAISQAEHSVVSIARVKPAISPKQARTEKALHAMAPFEEQFWDDPESPLTSAFIPTDFGSGVIIGVDPVNVPQPRAYILTNYHVVKGATRVNPNEAHPSEYELYVKLSNRLVARAKIYAADPRSDLAVVTISDKDPMPLKLSELKSIKLGDGSRLKKGQLVIALGNPYGSARDGSASASWGMVSNLAQRPAIPRLQTDRMLSTLRDLGDLIQVDTRLNIGTSGGALINLKGEMVGLTTSLAALAGYEKSSGFAAPVDAGNLRAIQSLKEGKEVEYGFLGVSFLGQHQSPFLAQRRFPDATNVPDGISEFVVLPGGPADLGGLRDDEMIVSINGEKIHEQEDLTREINKYGPDARVRLTVWGRNGNGTMGESSYGTAIREVTLAKWGAYDEDSIIATNYRYPPWRGLVVDYSTARNKHNGDIRQQKESAFPKGVLILKLLPPMDANQTDIVEGNRILRVNDTSVATPHDFLRVVRDLKGNVTLYLNNGKQVTIPEPLR